jgi:hypothetical protein
MMATEGWKYGSQTDKPRIYNFARFSNFVLCRCPSARFSTAPRFFFSRSAFAVTKNRRFYWESDAPVGDREVKWR